MVSTEPFGDGVLPSGIRSRLVPGVNGLTVHVLEAGFESPGRPVLFLFHGFPELAYSWRKVMPPLAAAGYYVVAPDVRGYGRTGGTDVTFDDDYAPYSTLSKARDAVWLASALGVREVAAAIGHDAGAAVAACNALVRPDLFHSLVMMSAPFTGVAKLPFNTTDGDAAARQPTSRRPSALNADLAALTPPRKHYQAFYSTREANEDMWHSPQGVHAFTRGYYHYKSADWPGNRPYPLAGLNASELAKLPKYYVMDLDKGMAETVTEAMPSAAAIESCKWLPERELAIYAEEYGRTGYQGGFQGYRCGTTGLNVAELSVFAGSNIDVPTCFISGAQDWGNYQTPGALDQMRNACTDFRGIHFVEGAGHWVQQEQPEQVTTLLVEFLRSQS